MWGPNPKNLNIQKKPTNFDQLICSFKVGRLGASPPKLNFLYLNWLWQVKVNFELE